MLAGGWGLGGRRGLGLGLGLARVPVVGVGRYERAASCGMDGDLDQISVCCKFSTSRHYRSSIRPFATRYSTIRTIENMFTINGDLLVTCDLLQTLLRKTDSEEAVRDKAVRDEAVRVEAVREAVRDEAVREVVEMINQALAKVFSRFTSLSATSLSATSLSATGLYRAFAKGKSWLVIEGSTLDKHLLFALHRVVKKRGGVKGLLVNIDAATGPDTRLLVKFPMSKTKMANYEIAEKVLSPLFAQEPYPLSVTESNDHFVVEFGGALATAASPDWKAATAMATTSQSELRALVPIGDIAALMVKTAAALPRFELPMNLSHVSIQAPPVMGTTSTASTATRTRTRTTTTTSAMLGPSAPVPPSSRPVPPPSTITGLSRSFAAVAAVGSVEGRSRQRSDETELAAMQEATRLPPAHRRGPSEQAKKSEARKGKGKENEKEKEKEQPACPRWEAFGPSGSTQVAGPSERATEKSEEEKDKERKKRQAKRRAIERRREKAEQRWKDQLAKLAAEDEEDDKVKGDGEVNDDEEDELAP